MEATGRYQIHLARRAIAISRDCADAWSILGDRAPGTTAALPFYHEAVAAGERTLGAEYFGKEVGHFWGLVETRPYMRARYALADTLDADGQVDEAIVHYRELIRLNPGDNQGAVVLCSCSSTRITTPTPARSSISSGSMRAWSGFTRTRSSRSDCKRRTR